MGMREKLIELVMEATKKCKAQKTCHTCKFYGNGPYCVYMLIADHLISNEVTIPHGEVMDADDFCSYGERRTNG